MDLRLLFTALLLACNAGYLIWKAKTNPKGKLKAAVQAEEPSTSSTSVSSEKAPVPRSALKKPSDKLSDSGSDSGNPDRHVRFGQNTEQTLDNEDEHEQDEEDAVNAPSEPLSKRLDETTLTPIGTGMYAHLLKIITGPDEKDTRESIQINVSALPFIGTSLPEDRDKEQANRMLGDIARLVLDLPELEVDLTIRPAASSDDDKTSSASAKEWIQASDTFASSPWVASDVPEGMLAMIGLVDSVADVQKENERHLSQLLAILKPSGLKITSNPLTEGEGISSLSDTSNHESFDPLRPLLYTGKMPVVAAGNTYFTQPDQILNYLEIGPWIPVSDKCETEYSFVCSRWQIRVLAIRVAWPEKKRQRLIKRSEQSPLAEILWDRTMGFSAMINGQTSSTSRSEESIKTRIVLILDRAKHAAKIADELDRLATEERKTSGARGSNDTEAHLEAFKEMIYFVCPASSNDVRRIFSIHSKKKGKDKVDAIPKTERAENGKVVDLPPLKPSRKKDVKGVETGQ